MDKHQLQEHKDRQERVKQAVKLWNKCLKVPQISPKLGVVDATVETYLAESGANPAAIQILLGHESLSTTTRYINASDRYAERIHKKYHPLKE